MIKSYYMVQDELIEQETWGSFIPNQWRSIMSAGGALAPPKILNFFFYVRYFDFFLL